MAPEFDYAGNPIVTVESTGDATEESTTVDTNAAEAAESAEEAGAAKEAESLPEAAEETPSEAQEDETGEDGAGDEEQPEEEGGAKRPKQSKKKNAEFAAARRRAEQREAVEKARAEERQKAQAEIDDIIARMNLQNPYTGTSVKSKADYDAWQDRHREEQLKTLQRKSGMDDDEMRDWIRSLPEVREAEAEKAKAQEIIEDARRERAEAFIESELAKIREFEPSVKDLDDIGKLPEHEDILEMVQRGYRLSDAWKLTHYDKVVERQAEAARESAARNAAGKDHLAATKARGKGGVTVPREVMAYYKAVSPGKSEAEIAKHYAKYYNSKK